MVEVMNDDARAATIAILKAAGLPGDLKLVIYGNGKTRHVAGKDFNQRAGGSTQWDSRQRSELTWCGMFDWRHNLRVADLDSDATKSLCGACLRTQSAIEARARDEKNSDAA